MLLRCKDILTYLIVAVLVIASRYIFYAHVETAYHTNYLLLGPIDNDQFVFLIYHERFNLPGFSVPGIRVRITYSVKVQQYNTITVMLRSCPMYTLLILALYFGHQPLCLSSPQPSSGRCCRTYVSSFFCLGSLNYFFRPKKRFRKREFRGGIFFDENIWDGHEHRPHKAAPCCWGRG